VTRQGRANTFAVKVFRMNWLRHGLVYGRQLLPVRHLFSPPSVIEGTYFGPNAVAVGGVAPSTSRVSRSMRFMRRCLARP